MATTVMLSVAWGSLTTRDCSYVCPQIPNSNPQNKLSNSRSRKQNEDQRIEKEEQSENKGSCTIRPQSTGSGGKLKKKMWRERSPGLKILWLWTFGTAAVLVTSVIRTRMKDMEKFLNDGEEQQQQQQPMPNISSDTKLVDDMGE